METFKEKVHIAERQRQAKEINFSFHEIVTLASLIEKETGLDEERPLISSVFHNRLAKKMRLQTDPTVIYAMAHFDGNIRKKDLSIDSPYNTYKNFGLPPGPIASPGIDSINAALKSDKSEFLYFVSRKDDLIKTKGERVSPKEIENTLCGMEGVAEAAVIGVPDNIFGQAIKAFIVKEKGSKIDEKAVLKYCRENLESFMCFICTADILTAFLGSTNRNIPSQERRRQFFHRMPNASLA